MIIGVVALAALFLGIVIAVATGQLSLRGDSGPSSTSTSRWVVPSRSAVLTSVYQHALPYQDCAPSARDGRYNVHIGDPAYNPALDRNHGIACERG
ncbi:excalibur calcium-binding domain-containing protein [Mycobacterium sp.]|uniref:excalibur calcium-binding domain-containing protein n=1 Tax=Mycobacterium sp. TaxID=1785 RepID=UPI003F96E3E0